MSKFSIFGADVQPKKVECEYNIIRVTDRKELFFDVFECSFNGKKIIVEKIKEFEGNSIVKFQLKKDTKIYNCEALLEVNSNVDNDLLLNGESLSFAKDTALPKIRETITEKTEKIIPKETIYEDKIRDVSEKIIKESQEKAQKLYDNKLKEYKKHKQLIAKQAEEYLNEKTESIRQELYEQYIDFLSSNDKKVNNLIKSNIDDITLSIDENNKEILSKVDKLSNLNKEELAKILSENIININNNLDSKVKDLNDQLDIILHDNNTKLNKLDEKTSRLLEKNIKHTDEIAKNITSKIKQVDEKIEDYKIDTFKHVVEKVADNKTEIEASLKNTISEINEQVDIKRDEVEKILAAELSNINEKLNIFSEEEDKKYKQLLENLNNLNKGEVKEILSEKINDKQLNSLKLDISKQFQNEMMSIKRLIEMSSGGGSVAKQFANGGTMNGDLHVTGKVTAGSTISGTLQTNNNRSVVIGALAAPNEAAPNTEINPTIYRENVAIGYQALNSASTGTNNVAIGTDALKSSTDGKNNIAIGKRALETVNSDRNIALGFNCLNVPNVNDDNIVIGSTTLQSLSSTGIDGNIIIGKGAGNSGNTGLYNDNIILGRAAFQGTTASSVADTILLGQRAGKSLKGVGDNDIGIGKNVFFGANAGFNSAGNNIAIGENAQSNPIEATAKVNGATSSTTTLVVDSNAGKILTGMTVTGTGISGTVTVTTVTDQNNLVLSSAQTLSNDVDLTFTKTEPTKGSIKIGADGGTAGSFSTNISTVDTVTTLPGGGNRTVNKVTGSHSGLVGGFANIVSAETAFIGGGKDNVIAEQATGAAILGGFDNDITGVGSAGMALGSNLRVQGANQVVVGRYNIGNDSSKFIVGAGYGEATRTNAFEVRNNSQLKLGKYGTTNYTYDGSRNYNILAVGAANNVVEIPLHDDKLDSQFLNFDAVTVNAGHQTHLSLNVNKIVRIGWTGSTGTHQILLPSAANFSKRTIKFVTNSTLPSDAIVTIDPSGSDTLNGLTGGISLVGTYKAVTVWSDGTEWYKISE